MNKKAILKKYTGQGGPGGARAVPIPGRTPGEQGFEIIRDKKIGVKDVVKEIPGTIFSGIRGFGRGIKRGLEWAGGQIGKDIKGGEKKWKDLEEKNRKEKSGEYIPDQTKGAILKKLVKKSK